MRALTLLLMMGCMAPQHHPAQRVGVTPPPPGIGPAPVPLHSIPERPAGALGGTEFIRHLGALAPAERRAALLGEVLRGNIPGFLRGLTPVTLHGRIDSRPARVTVWVMPDYLSVGADEDFVRVPLDFHGAAKVARAFGMTMPTRKLVDAVYSQASLRLTPQPMTPGPGMTSTSYLLAHNRRIERQRAGRALGALIAGHKKDLVITNRLWHQRPPRVAIYGWHRGVGDPIQPLSTVHGATYANYSHGFRLVAGVIRVNGVEHAIYEALQEPSLARILSLEGTIRLPTELLPAGWESLDRVP